MTEQPGVWPLSLWNAAYSIHSRRPHTDLCFQKGVQTLNYFLGSLLFVFPNQVILQTEKMLSMTQPRHNGVDKLKALSTGLRMSRESADGKQFSVCTLQTFKARRVIKTNAH